MFPNVFEWIWDPGHVIFMGIVWIVILVLFSGVTYVLGKTIQDSLRDDERDESSELIGKQR